MLTKEKCKMALNWLKGAICTECPRKYPIGFSKCIEEFSNTLQQLIEEHFDNPPLKFEELKEGMWLWDNFYKSYDKLYGKWISDGSYINKGNYISFKPSVMAENYQLFEENRFYRREVEQWQNAECLQKK